MDFDRVVVASHNPVKLHAIENAFQAMALTVGELEPITVESGVSDQPMSDSETLQGATNRAMAAMAAVSNGNAWVGIEGGIEFVDAEMFGFAWIVIRTANSMAKSRTATFPIPHAIAELVHQGVELGKADDMVFGRSNSKQNEGAVGLLTGGVVDRLQLYEHAAKLALIPFKNRSLFST